MTDPERYHPGNLTLANECDLDYSQINRMELGKVDFRISNFFRIAKVLINPQELY
jgi:predicted transcriptional regulator